jgi:hypothetical protein
MESVTGYVTVGYVSVANSASGVSNNILAMP